MKTQFLPFALAVAATMISLVGCAPSGGRSETVAEGVIYSVEYRLEKGGTGGFTRLNSNQAVPGGNGSWNEDAYGRLTRDFLFITHPQRKDWDLGPQVIPVSRLVSIQFGEGSIKTINPNQPAPPK